MYSILGSGVIPDPTAGPLATHTHTWSLEGPAIHKISMGVERLPFQQQKWRNPDDVLTQLDY